LGDSTSEDGKMKELIMGMKKDELKIVIEKYVATSFADFLTGQWHWHVESDYSHNKGGITFTYKGAERKAQRSARNWKQRRAKYNRIEITVN
jgi:hypothetical protein